MTCLPLNQLTCFLTYDVYSVSYRVWSETLLVQDFLNGSLLFWCLGVYQCVRLFWVSDRLLFDFFFLHTQFHLFCHFWRSKSMRQERSLSPSWRILHYQCRIFFVLRLNKGKVVANSGKATTWNIDNQRDKETEDDKQEISSDECKHRILQVNGKCRSYVPLTHILQHTVQCIF